MAIIFILLVCNYKDNLSQTRSLKYRCLALENVSRGMSGPTVGRRRNQALLSRTDKICYRSRCRSRAWHHKYIVAGHKAGQDIAATSHKKSNGTSTVTTILRDINPSFPFLKNIDKPKPNPNPIIMGIQRHQNQNRTATERPKQVNASALVAYVPLFIKNLHKNNPNNRTSTQHVRSSAAFCHCCQQRSC